MVLSNVIVDVTTLRCSFVFGQSCAKVSAGFTNVRSLAVAAFDLVYYQRLYLDQYCWKEIQLVPILSTNLEYLASTS